MGCSTPGFPVHHQLLELAQIHAHWVSDAIQPSHSLLSPSPAFSLSQHQGLFKWVSSLLQVAKVLEFQLSISPSSEYSGLISFRIDWFDILAVQGTPLHAHSFRIFFLLIFSSCLCLQSVELIFCSYKILSTLPKLLLELFSSRNF